MKNHQWRSLAAMLCLPAMTMAGSVSAQGTYPSKPVRIIVTFAVGGTNDLLARLLGPEMQKDFGQSMIVENIAGAGGIIGTAAAAKAASDGHTILMTTNVYTINAALRLQLPYDPLRSFVPVTLLTSSPNMLVVKPESPIASVADYLKLARAKPGEVTYATSGVGTSPHMAGEQLSMLTGTRYNHIPYAAANQSIQAVIAGTVVSSWSTVFSGLPFFKAGTLKALAVADERRSVLAPGIPTFAELGIPGMRSETWHGMFYPAGVSPAIASQLNAELMKLLNRAEMRDKLLGMGAEPVGLELDKFASRIREEIETYKKIVVAGGIKPE